MRARQAASSTTKARFHPAKTSTLSATYATTIGTSKKLWLSPAMQARRQKAKSGCFCTHESNSYYPSLPFNPKHLIQIKRLEREMKKSRKKIEREEAKADGLTVKA